MHKATYGDLDRTLLTLGFTVKPGVNEFGFPFNFYENLDHDAWVVVPGAPKEQRLHTAHLMAAEHTVVWKGVAESERFHKLLDKHDARMKARAS